MNLPQIGSRIEAAYRALGHSLGWRFVTGPAATFHRATEVGLITLNPGGSSEPSEHPRLSSEAGSSYWVESWNGYPPGQAPLQRQIQMLLAAVASARGSTISAAEYTATRVLTSHFIPFRSPSFATLERPAESIEFARAL